MVKNIRLGLVFGVLILVAIAVFVMAAGIDSVTLVSPANESFTNGDNDSIEFIFNYTGENATASCELFINGTSFGVNSTVANNTNTTVLANNTIIEGFHDWYINCTNGTTTQSDIWFFTVDWTFPQIDTAYPVNGTSYATAPTTFNFSYVEDNCAKEWYSNDSGTTNYSVQNCGINFTGMVAQEGTDNNTWIVYMNDSAGNENSSSVTFTYDATNPAVSLLYPTATNYSSLSELNFSATDTNRDTCWYSTNSSVNVTTDCDTNKTGLTPETEGSNTWTIYANDSAGNENSSSVTFTYDTTAPNVVAFNSPADNANISSTQVLNVTVNDTTLVVDTVFFNVTNASGEVDWLSTSSDGDYWNATLNTSALNDGDYNITVYANDSLGHLNSSEYITVTVDNSGPSAELGANPVAAKNSSNATIIFDLKCSDNNGVDTLQLWGNWSGAWAVNDTNSSVSNNTFSNISVVLSEGVYKWGAYCNDSLGNEDWSVNRTVIVDVTNPTASASCSPASVSSGSSVTCSCTGTDATSGVNTSTASSTVTTSATGTFSYTCSVTDYAGNSASNSASYLVSASSSSGSSSTTNFWTKGTHIVSTGQFAEGFTKQLSVNQRLRVQVGSEDHHVGVVGLTSTTATINISSDPQQIVLTVGDSEKVEVSGDDYYDILVSLNSINDGKADVTIQSINELIVVEDVVEEEIGNVETVADVIVDIAENKGNAVVWIIVGFVIVGVGIVVVLTRKKKQKGKK